MSTPDFLVVFSGAALDGFDPLTVQAQVEAALHLTEDQSGKLFSGKQVIIKRTQDKTEALTLAQQLKKLGADVSVRLAPKPDAAPKAPAPTEPPATRLTEASAAPQPASLALLQAEPSPDRSGLSLAENDGFIVPPAPPVAPLNLDLSGLSAMASFDEPLQAPKDHLIPELDLSSMSLKDNDGSPLVAPTPDLAPSVAVPDFDLAAPGALLETIGLPEPVAVPDLSNHIYASRCAPKGCRNRVAISSEIDCPLTLLSTQPSASVFGVT